MTTYVLIPGAGGVAWYWHLLEAELRERGHEAVAVDLPADDDSAGLSEYADAVVAANAATARTSSWWPSRWAGSRRRWCASGCPWTCW